MSRSNQWQPTAASNLFHSVPSPARPGLVAFLVLLAICLPGLIPPASAAATATSSAFGEQVNASLVPLLGSTTGVNSGPLPTLTKSAPPAYHQTATASPVDVPLGPLGDIVQADSITVTVDSAVPGSDSVSASSQADGTNVSAGALLGLNIGAIDVNAAVTGPCGGPLQATGSTSLSGASGSGLLGAGLSISPSPAPNTVLLNQLGILIVLNEQSTGGNGTSSRFVSVNAIHISIQNSLLAGLGLLTGDIVLGHAEASLACGAAASADLELSLSDSPDPVIVNGTLTYLAVVTNHGPDPATGTVLSYVLPAGASFLSASSTQGSCSGTSSVSCALGTIAGGGNASATIKIKPAVAGSLVSSASVASTVPDPGLANNSASAPTLVQTQNPGPQADLSLSKSASAAAVIVNGTIDYSLSVVNHGPDAASNVVVIDPLPAGSSLVSATASQGSCSGAPTLTCTLGSLSAGGSTTVTIRVKANVTGALVNSASVSSSAQDPNLSNNQASVTVMVQNSGPGGADLSLIKTANVTTTTVGAHVTFTLTISNAGPDAASAVTVVDELPSRVHLVSMTSSQGSCSGSTSLLCHLGTLLRNATAVVTLVVQVDDIGTIVNAASVASPVNDPDLSNNDDFVSISATASTANSGSDACRIDVQPAATLLIPYFAVDLDSPTGITTLFSINNSASSARLAHVTVWTDWAIPSLTFDVYLTGYDVQTINMRDILNGNLPATGFALSPGADKTFPGCNGTVAGGSQLAAIQQQHIQASHLGKRSPVTGTCAGSLQPDNRATGYVTIDVANRCSTLTPADPGYFAANGTGVAGNDNVLWGDYMLVNPGQNSAQGDTAVHIRADSAHFGSGDYTFYARYVGGSGIDGRQPLGTSYASRYLTGGAFTGGTELLVWRDTMSPDAHGVTCGQQPSWGPLPLRSVLQFDEDENSTLIPACNDCAPWATQAMAIGSTLPAASSFGWLRLDLWHESSSIFGDVAQGWVMTTMSAEGRFSVGYRAVRLDSACDF